MVIMAFGSVSAEIFQVGSGTSTWSYPFYTTYMDAKTQTLYTQAQLAASGAQGGVINSLALQVSSLGNVPMNGFKIYMTNYTGVTLPASAMIAEGTLVYSTPVLNVTATGWNTFALQTPFEWDGNSSLVITYCFNNNSWSGTTYVYCTTASNSNETRYSYSDLLADDGCTYTAWSKNTSTYKPNIRLDIDTKPALLAVYPPDGSIVTAGALINFTDPVNQPAVEYKRNANQPATSIQYKIYGPSSNPQTIYTAMVEGSGTFNTIPLTTPGNPVKYKFTEARGIGAHVVPGTSDYTGELDLSASGISGGQYTVEATFFVAGMPELTKTVYNKLIVSLPWDLTASGIASPVLRSQKKYPLGASIPVRVNSMNVGTQPIDSLRVTARVYTQNGTTPLLQRTIMWVNHTEPLQTGDLATVNIGDFIPNQTGVYRVEFTTELLTWNDQDLSNNSFPVSVPHYFEVAYGVDATAKAITLPASAMYVGHPVVPQAIFGNNGVDDISNVPANIKIFNPSGVKVFDNDISIESIPYSGIQETTELFGQAFVPADTGVYTVTVTVSAVGDGDASNNSFTKTFTVLPAMAGIFTISANSTAANNYTTIQSAVEALYQRGITGPVTFVLTDNTYSVGDIYGSAVALDLTSTIVGVSSTNTIKFVPSTAKSVIKGSVTINLNSNSGIGIKFGQSSTNPSQYAPVNKVVNRPLKKMYANSLGHITFDGGNQKSFTFKVNTGTENAFRAPFFLAAGSQNITIKNCIISGEGANPSLATLLPLSAYDATQQRFDYQSNNQVAGTFSTGILVRNNPPMESKNLTNTWGLDTLVNSNNVISDNEISNFGYGIVAIGNGILFNTGAQRFQRYYNTNNIYNNNKIYNVARAGIFLGFEENSEVRHNRIYNVSNASKDAAGIIAGGEASGTRYGYNNIGLNISANEISNIISASTAYGIKVEQFQVAIGSSSFPDVEESMRISSNSIWDVIADNATANRIGVLVRSSRDLSKTNAMEQLLTPRANNYNVRNSKIVNNTIVIPGDAGVAHTGFIAGVAIQQATNTYMKNNAITILDPEVAENVELTSCVFYQGVRPSSNNFRSDRNAFYYTNPAASIYRYVETDATNAIIDNGYSNEFANLENWQLWTGADKNSIFYNFMNDLTFVGAAPAKLRVKSSPIPTGSMINNRGDRVEGITEDIDGDVRGVADQRYDIGADEFNGNTYSNDVEVVRIAAPGAYKNIADAKFNDAEYIMTTSPVEVTARVRNNGSITQVGRPVTVNIYQELANGAFATTPVVTKTVPATISSTEDIDVNFLLGDGQGSDDFRPTPYAQLAGQNYTPAAHFGTMLANVTPRYKIEVTVPADEMPANNINKVAKIVRFYIKQSSLDILTSVENSFVNIGTGNVTPTAEQIDQFAGRLNADTLKAAFARMGWYTTVGEDRHDFDMFDRNGWESRSVNYPLYRTLIWGDGNDKSLTRRQIEDLTSFANAGTTSNKRNIIMGSQEMTRSNDGVGTEYTTPFIHNVLKTSYNATREFPTAMIDTLVGSTIAKNVRTYIVPTFFPGDANPSTPYINVLNNNIGLSTVAYYYANPISMSITARAQSVSTSTVTNVVCYYATDWRHFSNAEQIMRSSIDFIETNGSTVVPVELVSFDAEKVGNRVELAWSTASEVNSSRFEIERATVKETGTTQFVKIDEVRAAGNSNTEINYNTTDRNVEMGNKYAYRLKFVDNNGDFDYSEQKIVDMNTTDALYLNEVAPNPVHGTATINFGANSAVNASVTVFDVNGKEVATIFNGELNGAMTAQFNSANFAAGAYVVVLRSGDITVTRTINVIK